MLDMTEADGVLVEREVTYLFLPLAHSFALLIQLLSPKVQRGFWEMPAAAIANDADRLRRCWIEQGFVRAEDSPPAEEFMAWYRPNFAALWQPQPFTFTPEFSAQILGQLFSITGPHKNLGRYVTIPQEYVFTNRIFVGLYSILGALRATADWMAIFQENTTGQPITELGRLDADFFAARSSAS